jgi:hypothetical protein
MPLALSPRVDDADIELVRERRKMNLSAHGCNVGPVASARLHTAGAGKMNELWNPRHSSRR